MGREPRLAAFWKEVRRRRVVRSGGFYVAAAFVLLQLGEIVLPAFNAPDWVMQSLVVVLLLGLPVAVAFAWVYDLTPQGLERTKAEGPPRVSFAPRVALLLVTLVAAGLGTLWFQRNARSAAAAGGEGGPVAGEEPTELEQPTAGSALLASADAAEINAIAVLPLENLTGGDDLFARQLHEEIITQLGELTTAVRVVSRTSAARYANSDMLLPEIAAELRVQAIVTGSVAMAPDSDTVRITVRLWDAPEERQMYSETFEREMKDILRLQREVAVRIATSIQGELDPDAGAQRMVAAVDRDAWMAVARGKDLAERGGWTAALAQFEEALDRDPGYALAWAWHANALVNAAAQGDSLDAVLAQVEAGLRRARELGGAEEEVAELDLAFGAGFLGTGVGVGVTPNPDADRDRQVAVLALDPESDSLTPRELLEESRFGRLALQGLRVSGSPLATARRQMEAGRYDSAAVALGTVVTEDPANVRAWSMLESLHVRQSDYPGAVRVLEDRLRATEVEAGAAAAEIETLHEHFAEEGAHGYWEWRKRYAEARLARGERVSQLELATAAVHMGDLSGALDHLEAALQARDRGLSTLRADPTWDTLRRDPRFVQVVEGTKEIMQRMRESLRGASGGDERQNRQPGAPTPTTRAPTDGRAAKITSRPGGPSSRGA